MQGMLSLQSVYRIFEFIIHLPILCCLTKTPVSRFLTLRDAASILPFRNETAKKPYHSLFAFSFFLGAILL